MSSMAIVKAVKFNSNGEVVDKDRKTTHYLRIRAGEAIEIKFTVSNHTEVDWRNNGQVVFASDAFFKK